MENGRKKLAARIEAAEEEDDEDEDDDDEEGDSEDEDDDDEKGDYEDDDEDDDSENDAEDESDDIEDETEEEEEDEKVSEPEKTPVETSKPDVVEAKVEPKVAKPKFNIRTKKSPSAIQALKSELAADGSKPAEEEEDEYQNDTSDEEDIRNTVGNIPMHWYDEYKHIGYNWDAKKIMKGPKGDQLDDFLKRMEDPNFWRTVKDAQTGQDIIISEADIELIKRINSQKIPDAAYNDYTVSFILILFYWLYMPFSINFFESKIYVFYFIF